MSAKIYMKKKKEIKTVLFINCDATLTEKEHIPLYRLVTFEAAFWNGTHNERPWWRSEKNKETNDFISDQPNILDLLSKRICLIS